MRSVQIAILSMLLLVARLSAAGQEKYSAEKIDSAGQLHILTESGRDITPVKMKDQVAFGAVEISPDRRTIAWYVEYDNSAAIGFPTDPTPGKLVVYQNGRIVHCFNATGTFWGWSYVDHGRQIAYSEGPLHGNPYGCVLRDVDSGHVIQRWEFKAEVALPKWAAGIRCDGN